MKTNLQETTDVLKVESNITRIRSRRFRHHVIIPSNKVAFFNMIKFTEEITTASLTGNFLKYIDRVMKNVLIILDDFTLRTIDEQTRIALYQLLDENKENYRLSIIITSLLPTEDWYDYLKPGSQAESILDRLFSYAEKINLR